LPTPVPLPAPLAEVHRELGIPISYAADRRLSLQPEADETKLVDIGPNPDGRPVRLTADAAGAWHALHAAARRDRIELLPISGFRSVARQTEIIRMKLAAGQSLDSILRLVAAPGFSEHHTGRALDIGAPGHVDLEENFAATPEFRWLQAHAADHGFQLSFPRQNPHGIGFEPWHWLFGR
jgi:D-alanyl-D-alanine carboxypeptidase